MAKSIKKSFMIYNDWQGLFEALGSDEERGKLVMALFEHVCGSKEHIGEELSTAGKMALLIMSAQLDRDYEKWENVCKRNAENIRKRWDKSDTDVYE